MPGEAENLFFSSRSLIPIKRSLFPMKKAILYLADGTCFFGESLSVTGETAGECVFNTAMTGYQEILTDPSYAGQIVVMTYPLIGNYGVNPDDVESDRVHVKGFVVKEFCRHPSNFRATQGLIEYLNEHHILAMEGVDTRALTKHLRLSGAMKGIISTTEFDPQKLAAKLADVPEMTGSDWVKEVTPPKSYIYNGQNNFRFKVAALDCGMKRNILRILSDLGCQVHVFPAFAKPQEIAAIKPDGLFISNGPGDPAAVPYVVDTVRSFIGRLPIFGICLGNQIVGLALGGKTYKLKFGHHGANHPAKDVKKGRISITSQNHGFCVDMDSLNKDEVEVIHLNLNDRSVEGLRHKRHPVFTVQYHPEAAPGPHDARYLFEEFIEMMKQGQR